mgnify:CR=1 FL=1
MRCTLLFFYLFIYIFSIKLHCALTLAYKVIWKKKLEVYLPWVFFKIHTDFCGLMLNVVTGLL